MSKKQQQLVALSDLVLAGVKVTICKARKAPKQTMRCKNSGGFVIGGNRPSKVKASSFGL